MLRLSITLEGSRDPRASLARLKDAPAVLGRALEASAVVIQEEIRHHATGKTVGKDRGVHKTRGNLARSWQKGTTTYVGGDPQITLGSELKYAAIHEEGGTIRPVSARFLTVPISKSADRRRASDFPEAFVLKSKTGDLFIARAAGKNLELLYALKTSVDIPARRYVTNAIEDSRPEMDRIFDRAIDALIGGIQ